MIWTHRLQDIVATVALLGLLACADAQSRRLTCGNVQPLEEQEPIAFDCESFNLPVPHGPELSSMPGGLGVSCSFKPEAAAMDATLNNCCACSTYNTVGRPVPDMSVRVSNAVKASGQPATDVAVADALSYTITVGMEACLVGNQLRDIVLSSQLPAGFSVAANGIRVVPNGEVCFLDESGQLLTCKWRSISCFNAKAITITGAATQPGKLSLCASATTSSPEEDNVPNKACSAPVVVTPGGLGSCCSRRGACIPRMTKTACRGSVAQGGVAGQAWYGNDASLDVCLKSCQPARKSGAAAEAAATTAAAGGHGGVAAAAPAATDSVVVPGAAAVAATEAVAAAVDEASAEGNEPGSSAADEPVADGGSCNHCNQPI